MLWTAFPDQLDPAALDIVLNAFKGQVPDKVAATLATFNVGGFAASKVVGEPQAMHACPDNCNAEVEEAFAHAKLACSGTAAVGFVVPWQLILSVVIKVLTMLVAA